MDGTTNKRSAGAASAAVEAPRRTVEIKMVDRVGGPAK
jgi:hypothetical protein